MTLSIGSGISLPIEPEPAEGSADRLPIDSLDVTGSPRIAGEDVDHVAVLASVGTELPPITVRRATRWVVDGRHRLRAAELRDEATISARFFDGDQRSAFVLAVRMNVSGGLPLSLADRKAAAARVVCRYACWSDRLIASVTGLSPHTVSEVRARTCSRRRCWSDERARTRPPRIRITRPHSNNRSWNC